MFRAPFRARNFGTATCRKQKKYRAPNMTMPRSTTKLALSRASTRWIKGQSGNPAGRPRGSPNKGHAYLRELLNDGAEAVIASVIAAAISGDMAAARLVLDRVLPRSVCDGTPEIDSTKIATANDAAAVMGHVLSAALSGDLSTGQASNLANVIDQYRRLIETVSLEERIVALERRLQAAR